jgi:DNA-binding beta-propeller fold protein YncE
MSPKLILSCVICSPFWAQGPDAAADAQAAQLRELVRQAPRLAFEKTELKIQGPGGAVELGYPSSVTMDKTGVLYVLQRGDKADPVLVVNREGRLLRSWGKGMFKIPHSIRVDPAGNIWTVDAASSRIFKFTPQGEKLMEISVGEQPATKSEFNGTTDIAFAPNGRIFISDGYGNARILEYTAAGKRVRQWGSAGTGPGEFHLPHGITIDEAGILYVADRENGRLQRFDLDGHYLGEWANLGKVFSVTARDGALWIGIQQRNEPNGSPGWFLKLDKRSGKILGYVESARGQHTVNITATGDLLAGARPDAVLWFRAQR